MEKIKVDLGKNSYHIYIEKSIIKDTHKIMDGIDSDKKILIISDENVIPIYGDMVKKNLQNQGYQVYEYILKPGEKSKHYLCAQPIYSFALDNQLTRKSSIITLGGGVAGDLGGFVAATYMRGINFIQIPTSLLAQVDSSIGGKVAVNHDKAKNIIGCFYQPKAVIIDPETLTTLPDKELYSGLAEVIKYGIIYDYRFLKWLYTNIDDILNYNYKALVHLIKTCCKIKSNVVEIDEHETGLRAILNFGHTVGHSIESSTGYNVYTHGQAVSIGMVVESLIALKLGLIEQSYFQLILKTLNKARLPTKFKDIDTELLYNNMGRDKKNISGKITFILPTSLGKVDVFRDVDKDTVMWALGQRIL
ncbi:MAG: 3-dehydroquinate synthase [Clostridia bacterium]|nr:3-dehydroquinate synthase [Clostridia bacterium]